MSSYRRKTHGPTLDEIFEQSLKGSDLRFSSILQLAIFLPYFGLYLFVSTVLSAFFRGGRSIWWTILACYTFFRLMFGFFLVILFRTIQAILEHIMTMCDNILFSLRSKKETHLLQQLETNCSTYAEFEKIGRDLDALSSSIQKWKRSPNSDDFDYELLELQLKTMKSIRSEQNGHSNDQNKLMQQISHVFRRTFCSLHNGGLYNTYCYIGTKDVIEEYFECLAQCVVSIREHSALSIHDRLEYFHRCKRSLGRTALCLSGGGSLSMAHCGVLRELIKNDCLPKVISGTSGGAIIAGYLATLTNDEIRGSSSAEHHFGYQLPNRFGAKFLPSFFEQLFGAYRDRVLMDSTYFINSIKKYVGDATFYEAFCKTGRHVNISVSYSTKNKGNTSHAHSILLNHVTSPNVYIWSAVTASCALPGLMKPQQLWSKPKRKSDDSASNSEYESEDRDRGHSTQQTEEEEEMVPYYPDGIQWVDGSLQADIPIQSLQELFRVNYTIVSQVNPHVTPFLLTSHSRTNSFGLKMLEMLDEMASKTVNHQLDRLVKLKAIPSVYGHNFDKFALQNFTGDVTIVPRIPLNLRFKILSHPTDDDMVQYIDIGEKATWPHVQHIQHVLRIEQLIDATIASLKKDSAARRSSANHPNSSDHADEVSFDMNRTTTPPGLSKKQNSCNDSSYYLR